MKTNGWIASSQRVYRWLLHLYPQAYRETYEEEMFHLFTDQCREANKQQGRWGVLSLWLRTLPDVGISAFHEHISDPQASIGLLEAAPNAPLPWKGVLLVLIPGLIFFVSQVEQVTSSKDWFFLVFYRGAYLLILPVLLVWVLTRRFPVWGLIPLGVLYGTLASYNPAYLIRRLGLYTPPDSLSMYSTPISPGYLIPVCTCMVLIGGFIYYLARQQQISRSVWKWLGLYGLLIVLHLAGEIYSSTLWLTSYSEGWTAMDVRNFFWQMPMWYLYDSLPFLLLVFIGTLFARRHGGLAFLILLGYLLPTVIFGRYGIWNDDIPFYVVSLSVLVYRFAVALVGPVWLVRAASRSSRQGAAAIPVAVAIVCHIALNVIVYLAWAKQFGPFASVLDFTLNIWEQLIVASGLGLAVALYLPREESQAVVPPPELVATVE